MKAWVILGLTFVTNAVSIHSPTKRDATEYDVILSPSADTEDVLNRISMRPSDDAVQQTYANSVFRGFSGSLTEAEVETIQGTEGVQAIAPVIEIKTADLTSRLNAPWGVQRISQFETVEHTKEDLLALTYNYTYEDRKLGKGVDIYVIDTGIRATHEEFEGRAKMGFSFYPDVDTDDNGHGTHCAGTAAGKQVGVARKANLIGVKVVNGRGSGKSTGFIAGVDYVVSQHDKRKRADNFVASVASISLGYYKGQNAIDKAVSAMSEAGVHISVAAGNNFNGNACQGSPSGLGGVNSDVVVAGASNANDVIAAFSDTGPCVDVFAPGEYVWSSWNNNDTAYQWDSGTSMAAPHVAGIMAYFAATNPDLSTTDMKEIINKNAIRGWIRSGKYGYHKGTPFVVANNGINDGFPGAVCC